MPCPTPDGACIAIKSEDGLASIIVTKITGYSNKIKVEWETDISYPDQTVKCVYRKLGGKSTDRFSVPRNDGVFETPTVLLEGETILLHIRAEDSTSFNEWEQFLAISSIGWEESFINVTFGTEQVVFKSEFVTTQ